MAVTFFVQHWLDLLVLSAAGIWGVILLSRTTFTRLAHRIGVTAFYVTTLIPAVLLLVGWFGPDPRVKQLATAFALVSGPAALLMAAHRKFTSLRPIHLLVAAYCLLPLVPAALHGENLSITLAYLPSAVIAVAVGCEWDFLTALRHGRRVLRITVWGSLALVLLYPQFAQFQGQQRAWLGFQQISGLTLHPSALGSIALAALFLELVPEGRKSIRTVHALTAVAALAASQSRGTWLALLIGLAFYFLGSRRSPSAWMPYAVLIAAGSVIYLRDQTLSLLSAIGDDTGTLNGRERIWARAFDVYGQHRLVGGGREELARATAGFVDSGNAHNQGVQALAETGLVGFALLMVIVWLLFRLAAQHPRWSRGPMLGFTTAFLARFIVETPLYILPAGQGAVLALVVVTLLAARPELRSTTEDKVREARLKPTASPGLSALLR